MSVFVIGVFMMRVMAECSTSDLLTINDQEPKCHLLSIRLVGLTGDTGFRDGPTVGGWHDMKSRLVPLFGVLFLVHSVAAAAADPAFRRISAAEIRKLFSGGEFSDDVHWAERYKSGGRLEGSGMGRRFNKTWSVKNDMLCVLETTPEPGAQTQPEDCRQVWVSGEKVELRRDESDELPKRGAMRRVRR